MSEDFNKRPANVSLQSVGGRWLYGYVVFLIQLFNLLVWDDKSQTQTGKLLPAASPDL